MKEEIDFVTLQLDFAATQVVGRRAIRWRTTELEGGVPYPYVRSEPRRSIWDLASTYAITDARPTAF